MTRAKDISKILTDADISGTLDVGGETTLATHLNLGDNDKIKLGDSADLQIYHDGNSRITDVGGGKLQLETDGTDIALQKGATEYMARFFTDGAVELYYDNSKTFETVSGGAKVTGDLEVTSNVGIGNSSPSSFYSLADNLVVGTGSGGHGLTIYSGSSDSGYIGFNDTASASMQGFIQYNHNGDYMAFAPNGSERLRILSNGDVAINSTSSSFGGFGPAHLVLNTNQSRNSIIVGNNRQNNVAYGVQADGTTGTRYAMYILNSSGGEVGKISYTNTATSFATTSDHRVKENVDYDFDATTRLKQLKPCRFNFISDETNTLVDGFLAHEAQAVVPECVTGTHNEVDADGKAVMQAIDQSKIVPLLTKTILELEARITALEGA